MGAVGIFFLLLVYLRQIILTTDSFYFLPTFHNNFNQAGCENQHAVITSVYWLKLLSPKENQEPSWAPGRIIENWAKQ